MNILLPDTGLLFWMTVIFAVVFFVLAKFGFPVITDMVDRRTRKINDALAAARQADEKLASLTLEHERMRAATDAECSRMLQEAARQKEQMLEQARMQAREEAAKIVAESEAVIAREKEAALRDIRKEVATLSLAVAESIVRKNLSSESSQRDLADKLFDEIRQSSAS